jgi:hypothetical protein
MHVGGVPACKLTIDASTTAIQSTLAAPSGGLYGSMSFINLNDGIGASYNATAINGFWKTGTGAPVPTITAPVAPSAANPASAPDLTSGGNTTITVTDAGKTYVSTFARSIDAVSALFMADSIRGEYGFTLDGVFRSAMIMTLPTKPYYVYSGARAPFQRSFASTDANSCDDGVMTTFDREEYVGVFGDSFPNRPPSISWCGTANVYSFPSGTVGGVAVHTATAFNSPRMQALTAIQNAGQPAPLGKEGGHLQSYPASADARLVPTSSSVLVRSTVNDELVWQPAAHTYFGLPMLGFAISVATYNAGSPQQNFGNLNAMTTKRRISP